MMVWLIDDKILHVIYKDKHFSPPPGTFSLWCHPKFEDRCHSVVEFIERAIMHSKNGKFLYFLRSRVPGKNIGHISARRTSRSKMDVNRHLVRSAWEAEESRNVCDCLYRLHSACAWFMIVRRRQSPTYYACDRVPVSKLYRRYTPQRIKGFSLAWLCALFRGEN